MCKLTRTEVLRIPRNSAPWIVFICVRLTVIRSAMKCLIWQPDSPLLVIRSPPFPLPLTIIKAVEALAEKDGMKGLQVKTKTGQILWDSAWTAGVDYDEDDDDEDCDDDNVELPGVEIDEEEEEQLWEDLDENEVADLMDEAANPVQPEPQVRR